MCLSTDWLKAHDNMQHDFIFAVHGRVFGEPDLDAKRAELSTLTDAALRRRCRTDGAATERLAAANNSEERRQALLALHIQLHSFGGWVRLMYTDCFRQISVNGVMSCKIYIKGGLPQGCPWASSAFVISSESLGRHLRQRLAGRGILIPTGEEILIVSFADDMQLMLVGEHTVLEALDIIEWWARGTGMRLNAKKTEAMFIGTDTALSRPDYALYSDETADPTAPPPRLTWKRGGSVMKCVGTPVGPTVLADRIWNDLHTSMFRRLLRWSRVRLGYRARSLVLRSLISSQLWYTAACWPIPDHVEARITAMTRHYFWRGGLPVEATPDSPAKAYRCYCPMSTADVGRPESEGGWSLFSAKTQSTALLAQWVARLLAPGHAVWKALPRYWLRRALGLQSSAAEQVLISYDKPLRDSPLVTTKAQRVVNGDHTDEFLSPPARWRAYFEAWGRVTQHCVVTPPERYEAIVAEGLWHNRHMQRHMLAPWRPHAGTAAGRYIIAGIHKVDDIWDGDRHRFYSLDDIQQRCLIAAARYDAATRARVKQCVAELDETVLSALQRGVHEAGWKLPLTGTVEPLEENEWTSTLDAAVVPGADSVPHFCARVDRVVNNRVTATIGDIEEETGIITLRDDWQHTFYESELHRIAVITRGHKHTTHGYLDTAAPLMSTNVRGYADSEGRRQFTTAWSRAQLTPFLRPVVDPVIRVAVRRAAPLDASLKDILSTTRRLRWDRRVHQFWWRYVADAWISGPTRAAISGLNSDRYCKWCRRNQSYAADTVDHQLDECGGWTKLRHWTQDRLYQLDAPFDPDRPSAFGDFLLYAYDATAATRDKPNSENAPAKTVSSRANTPQQTAEAIARYPDGTLIVYTDGGCDGNGARGYHGASGWGVCITKKTATGTLEVIAELHGPIVTDRGADWDLGSERGTNNTGEVCAVIQALLYLAHSDNPAPAAILFDSQYAARATQGATRAKKNIELIRCARKMLDTARRRATVDFIHVKGHSADAGNNRADELVQKGKGPGPHSRLRLNGSGEGTGRFGRLRYGRYGAASFRQPDPSSAPATPPRSVPPRDDTPTPATADDAATSPRLVHAAAISAVRGAALRTINALHTGLLVDDRWWPPTCAAKRATDYLRNTIQLDYYRINIAAATNDDAADNHGGRKHDHSQIAAFARRWAGLAQTRRTGPVFKF